VKIQSLRKSGQGVAKGQGSYCNVSREVFAEHPRNCSRQRMSVPMKVELERVGYSRASERRA
jgi:hypothetical protein